MSARNELKSTEKQIREKTKSVVKQTYGVILGKAMLLQ